MDGLSTEQWLDTWGQAGRDGGMQARRVKSWFQERGQQYDWNAQSPELEEESPRVAQGDPRRLGTWARRAPKR
eukprot:6513801-Pyramimonas_sp.AAC.1